MLYEIPSHRRPAPFSGSMVEDRLGRSSAYEWGSLVSGTPGGPLSSSVVRRSSCWYPLLDGFLTQAIPGIVNEARSELRAVLNRVTPEGGSNGDA